MKNIIIVLLTFLSTITNAADYVIGVTPVANSIGDTQVNSISINKITNLQTSLNSKADTSTVNSALALKADQSSVNSALALKADISSLGSLATKSTVTNTEVVDGALNISKILNLQTSLNSKADTSSLGSLATLNSIGDAQVSSISNSKITGLGTLSTKNSLLDTDIPSLLSSKISDFSSAVLSAISSTLSNYVLKSDMQSPIVFRGSNSGGTPFLIQSGVDTLVTFADNKTDHSNGAMSSDGSTFTCQVSGTYMVSVTLTLNTTGDSSHYAFDNSPGRVFDVILFKNGLPYSEIAQDRKMYPGMAQYYTAHGSDVVDCVANDVIQIYAKHTISGAAISIPLLNSALYNYINIIKIGQY